MINIPLEYSLSLACLLFSFGLSGVLLRRNLVFTLMSLEIMLNAVALAFISASVYWRQVDGQMMFLFILVIAAAEAAVGLALIYQVYLRYKTLDSDKVSEMRG